MGQKRFKEDGFVQTIGLTQLAFRTIAINSMAQLALGHTQQHLNLRTFTMFHLTINHTQGICRQRFRSSSKEVVYVIAQAEMLGLGKPISKHT
jgi:hypothetical protein